MSGAMMLGALAALSSLASCSRDEIAPDCFYRDPATNECAVQSFLDDVHASCGTLPESAEGATFSHTPTAVGGSGGYTWSASGLPSGLAIDAASGQITGTPASAGSYTFDLEVEDNYDSSRTDTVSCTLEVLGRLELDLSTSTISGCVPADEDIRDYLVGGLSSAAVTCNLDEGATSDPEFCPSGRGRGILPAGLTWDPVECTATGTISPTRTGAFAWVIRVEQAGSEVYVPVCASNEGTALYHEVSVDFDGSTDIYAPLVFEVDTSLPFTFGGSTPSAFPGPSYEVRGPTSDCGNDLEGCRHWGLRRANSCTIFDTTLTSLSPSDPIKDTNGDDNIGFTHHLSSSTGDTAVDQLGDPAGIFAERPWVTQYRIRYCTADNDVDCDPEQDFDSNYQSEYWTVAIVHPQ